MLILSITRSETLPIPHATSGCCLKNLYHSFIWRWERCFESRSLAKLSLANITKAQANTGPAKGPRPTSSTPATMRFELCIKLLYNGVTFHGKIHARSEERRVGKEGRSRGS